MGINPDGLAARKSNTGSDVVLRQTESTLQASTSRCQKDNYTQGEVTSLVTHDTISML